MAGPAGTLSPSPKFVGADDAGNPIAGGKVYSYYAGSTTPAPTYSDADLDVGHINTNPVVLDAAGRATIFLNPGVSYKFILKSPADVTVWTQDNIAAVSPLQTGIDTLGTAGEDLAAGQVAYMSDGQGSRVPGRWYRGDSTNAYSSTQPTVGMVTAPILGGQTGSIRVVGAVTGLSGLVPGGNYYVGVLGALTPTRPGNGRLVGVADTSTSLVLGANPAVLAATVPFPYTVITNNDTGTVNDWAPGLNGNTLIMWTGTADLTVNSIAGGVTGQIVTIRNVANAILRVPHFGGSPPACFSNWATSAPTPLAPQTGTVTYQHDGVVWRMVAHEQGAWITPPYSAANFVTDGGTWTVGAADVSVLKYRLSGRTLSVTLTLTATSVAGGPTQLRIANTAYGGFATTSDTLVAGGRGSQGAEVRFFLEALGNSYPFLLMMKYDGTAWAASTDATAVAGQITFEVN